MKLTSQLLKKIVLQEAAKFGAMKNVEDVDADEVDADEYASTLENQHNYYKALGLEEQRLRRRLAKVMETRRRLARRI